MRTDGLPERGAAIRPRLLIVDDEAPFRETAARVLTRRGFGVEQAESGELALEMIAASPPDLVLLDLRLGGRDGIMTLREIRGLAPDLPVMIVTGQARFDDAVAGVRLDIVDFVTKPLDLERLAIRLMELATRGAPALREPDVAALVRPAADYLRLHGDQPLRDALALWRQTWPAGIKAAAATLAATGQTPPTPALAATLPPLLVFDRHGHFLGLLRQGDVIRSLPPSAGERSPYAPFASGMFLARCKLIGDRPVHELLGEQTLLDREASLGEAAHLFALRRVDELPVIGSGELVGVLSALDLFPLIADHVGGE